MKLKKCCTYDFEFLFNFPVDVNLVPSHALHGEKASAVEGNLGEYGGVAEVQVGVGAERDLAGARAAHAALLVANCVVRVCVYTRAAILLKKISSDRLACYRLF